MKAWGWEAPSDQGGLRAIAFTLIGDDLRSSS